ncbi:MAG: hypothetical protein HW421_937 [Ignavibacteria bacterium]|nr:hypothetical protein [Ignavibacteria bacterium]
MNNINSIDKKYGIKKFLNIFVSLSLITFSSVMKLSAQENIFHDINTGNEIEYVVRLTNGDILTGTVVEMISSTENGEGMKFKTSLGIAPVWGKQIAGITPYSTYNRHSHRIYFLPTAEPIGQNYFVGIFEMLFVYAGAGVSDWLSFTAGRSLIPGIPSNHQITDFNIKTTFYSQFYEEYYARISFAAGCNYGLINHDNELVHFYVCGTYRGNKSIITASIFYKAMSKDFYLLKFGPNMIDLPYENGSMGIGFGIDTKFTSWNDLHFIGELWNSNIGKPTNTGIMLGFRIANTQVGADFGIAFFTQPLYIPFMSFVWTPF